MTDYLPYFTMADPKAAEITIRQLLSHSAGMPDIAEWNYTDVRADAGALEDIVRSNSGQALLYPPGKDWAYSNLGFMVLGDVVAKVSGQSFEDYVQEHILMPLGMKSSTFLLSEVDPAALVSPHMYRENGDLEVSGMPYNRAYAPAAALFANFDNMARFAIANMNHGELAGVRVLPASAYDQMWTAQAASHWVEMYGQPVANYGLGWWVGDLDGRRLIGNYGAEDGYQTHLGIFPDAGFAVIVLANVMDFEEGSLHAYNIGNGIAEVLFGQ